MKSISFLSFFAIVALSACSQINIGDLQKASDKAEEVIFGSGTTSPLSNDEVVAGLREALEVGIRKSVDLTGKEDGFLGNDLIRIPFPEEAQKVKQVALDLGLTAQVQQFEETLNRAAEMAVKEAVPVFVDAIKGMSIEDGFAILKGENNAATVYLKDATTAALTEKFRPIVQKAVDAVELTKYWTPLVNAYNTSTLLTGGQSVDPDLTGYVTGRAIDGLFVYVEKEEQNIRANPVARVTDLLKRVFGQS
ncbi:MAG: DUF4197 domain-containing protein [Flavobacteriales bacterium]|nr:DUF4197 domain-containing protein [Flavobacteriales bacterium]